MMHGSSEHGAPSAAQAATHLVSSFRASSRRYGGFGFYFILFEKSGYLFFQKRVKFSNFYLVKKSEGIY